MRSLLRISGVWNFLWGLGIISEQMFLYSAYDMGLYVNFWDLLAAIFFIVTGVIYFVDANKEIKELGKETDKLTALGLISIIFGNLLTMILVLVAVGKIKKEYGVVKAKKGGKAVKKVDPEVRKIDMMLKLGVGMVLIAGMLFATSSWSFLMDELKVFFLILLGCGFVGLSKFSEERLKLKETTAIYWVLGMAFFVFSLLSAGYFEIFGAWFSLAGEGHNLFKVVLALLVAGLAFVSYRKFDNNKGCLYLVFASLFYAASLYLIYWEVTMATVLLILSIAVTVLICIKDENIPVFILLKKFAFGLAGFLAIGVLILYGTDNYASELVMLISSGLLILDLIYIGLLPNKAVTSAGIVALIIGLLTIAIGHFNVATETIIIVTSGAIASLFLILMYFRLLDKNEYFKKMLTIVVNFTLLIYFIVGFASEASYVYVALMGVLINIAYVFDKETENMTEYYLQPIKVAIFVIALLYWVNLNVFEITPLTNVIITYLTLFGLFSYTKEETLKFEYFWAFILMLLCGLMMSTYEEIIPSLIVLFSLPLPLLIVNNNVDQRYQMFEIPTFIFMLVGIYGSIVSFNILSMGAGDCALLTMAIYALVMIFTYKDKELFTIVNIMFILPYVIWVDDVFAQYFPAYMYPNKTALKLILESAFPIMVSFVSAKNLMTDNKHRDVLISLLVSYILLSVMFYSNLYMGLYIGLMGLFLMIFSYYNRDFKVLFMVGLGASIINIVYQMWDLWSNIPFWLYLLIVGLGLIGFVTNIQLKKLNEGGKKA